MEHIVYEGGPKDGQEETTLCVLPRMLAIPKPEHASADIAPWDMEFVGCYEPVLQTYDSWEQGQDAIRIVGIQYSRRDDGAVIYRWHPFK